MNYKTLEALTTGKNLPLTGENEEKETVIIEKGHNGNLKYYQLSTFQNNDWIRINRYYEDGSIDESYKR